MPTAPYPPGGFRLFRRLRRVYNEIMTVRKRSLSPGWYPEDVPGIERWFEEWKEKSSFVNSRGVVAGIVPHAGWYFSGDLAFLVFRSLDIAVDTVVVVGGHLPADAPIVVASEEAYDTPLGQIEADTELRRAIIREMPCQDDRGTDNTVEVQLPLLRGLLPASRALAVRVPAGQAAVKFGRAIAEAAERINRKVAVIGSTDLTHYGPQYRFSPAGIGDGALRWVKEVNDAEMIRFFVDMDAPGALVYAREHRAACSVGAAATAITFGLAKGAGKGELLMYRTSRERGPASSFVGYAAISYSAN